MQPFRRRPPGWKAPAPAQSASDRWTGLKTNSPAAPAAWLGKLFWASLLFVIVAAGAAAWVYWGGHTTVSVGNVEIKIAGPTSIRSGEAASLQVTVANHNSETLEYADLIAEYPPGTLAIPAATGTPPAVAKPLLRERLTLGTVLGGAQVNHAFSALFFGDKDAALPVNIFLEYRLSDSNAIFKRQSVFNLLINSSPLSLNLGLPSETSPDQTVVIDAEVISNTAAPFTGAGFTLTYPAGWHFTKSLPPPSEGNNFWRLGTIAPGEKKLIEIIGTLEGQDQEEKFFRGAAGLAERNAAGGLTNSYASASASLRISRPQVALAATINRQPLPYLAASREALQLEINWVNNLPVSLSNAEVTATLTGSGLDKASIKVANGYYQSTTDQALWNKLSRPELASIPPGGSGRLTLSFASLPLLTSGLTNPVINLTLKFHANRQLESGTGDQPTVVDTSLTGLVKINSVVQLAASLSHSPTAGALPNLGTLPPKVGQEVSYTAHWSLVNSSNDLTETTVTANLPPYVRFIGAIPASVETLTFTPEPAGGGRLVWDLGGVKAGTGLHLPPRAIDFQLAFTPSLNQVGQAPTLVLNPTLAASDLFTGASRQTELSRSLTTQLAGDPAFHLGDDKVIP